MAETKDTIIVVCTGNICRSPMGERLLRHALQKEAQPLRDLKVISAGTHASSGQPASHNSVKALEKVGINLADHKSQPVSEAMLKRAHAVFCMSQSHRDILATLYPEYAERFYLYREFMEHPERLDISDPFGLNASAYQNSLDNMAEAIPSLLAWLRKNVR